MSVEKLIGQQLKEREELGAKRSLRKPERSLVDFSSNDYLGLRLESITDNDQCISGSGGSRLLTGNIDEAICAEEFLSEFHKTESATIFGSGYEANLGLISALSMRGTTVVYDELSHASIIDGVRLGVGRAWKYKHNDLQDLEEKLKAATGEKIVITESLFSMDGDTAPLKEIVNISQKYDAAIVLDEAHATGVYGERGEGLAHYLGVADRIFARVHTFGKAIGTHGAAIVGSNLLKEFIVNFCRSFIYTTAMSPRFYNDVKPAYERMIAAKAQREKLWANIRAYKEIVGAGNNSPIQTIKVCDVKKAKELSTKLKENGFDVRAILSPTVAQGEERLRVCLHAFNSEEEILKLRDIVGS